MKEITQKIQTELERIAPVPNMMPHCADMLLSLVGLNASSRAPGEPRPDSLIMFDGYFKFGHQRPLFPKPPFDFNLPPNQLHEDLRKCLSHEMTPQPVITRSANVDTPDIVYPSRSCRPNPCLSLQGNRHMTEPLAAIGKPLQRLFIADVVWLFYMERMGTFQILGALLDDYAGKGKLPISSHTLTAFVLEEMIDAIKSGVSSKRNERVTAVLRSLGWVLPDVRERPETTVNSSFSQLFNKMIVAALSFYRDKRLAMAIQSTNAGTPSTATITEIADTMRLLKLAFSPFDYGRVYSDVLSGIVWTIATHAIVDELRDDIGIPRDFTRPDQFIPAAYDMLVTKQSVTNNEVNRYTTHKSLADSGRRILLDVQGLPMDNPQQAVKDWLSLDETEFYFETHRAAYRNVTGTDLGGLPPNVPIVIEQAA